MKKFLTLLFGGLIALTLFVSTGNTAKAEGHEHACHCEDVIPVTGEERNIIVSEILKSDEYKNVKEDLKNQGYESNGTNEIQVLYNYYYKIMIVGVPFTNLDGSVEMAVFFDGVYQDPEDLKN